MNYVEILRGRNALRVLAIVFGVLFLIMVALRIWATQFDTVDKFIAHVQHDPGVTTKREILPDGTVRMTIHDPDGTNVVVDDHGYYGKHAVITEPVGKSDVQLSHVSLGSVKVRSSVDNGIKTTVIDSNGLTAVLPLLGIALGVALIIATTLGAPFARENDGHLEIALTKPASRVRIALGLMAVDTIAIVAAAVMTLVFEGLVQLMFEPPHYDFSNWEQGVFAMICVPLAWYAMLSAITASLRRGYGAIQGLAWPAALALLVLAAIPWDKSALGSLANVVFGALVWINPLHYADPNNGNPAVGSLPLLLILVYGTVAVLQWRRVEA
jgi:ABC-type transport system involved in multi-copper enzyme maturation permease subunit